MRSVYWIWRRELHAMLRAPIVFVIGGLFLVVQGVAFAALLGALSDPRRPALLGALLEGQLAGTQTTWFLQLFVITLLGLRTIADEKRSGLWELALTGGASERAIIVGKWLAATSLYAILWIPTLLYFVVVAAFRTGGGFDVGTIAIGYVGAIALGAALLAWTIAASAATSQTLTAGALGYFAVVAIFLVGELPSVWPGLDVLDGLSIRQRLATLARGEIELTTVVSIVGLAATGLSAAIAASCAGRRRPREIRIRTGATLLIATIAIASGFAARGVRVDLSGNNSLDPRTEDILASIGPTTIVIVEPTIGGLDVVFDEVTRVVERMAETGPITVEHRDPATAPGGIVEVARAAGVPQKSLVESGAVIVTTAGKTRVIELLALATIARDANATVSVERLAVEQGITGALVDLTRSTPARVCATSGHAELPIDGQSSGQDWAMVAARLRGDGLAIETRGPTQVEGCSVVVVIGPTTPFTAEEALALQAYVRGGGGLLVAAASRPISGGGLAATGLEALLSNEGIELPKAIAIDPSLAVRELPGALLVYGNYDAKHPIDAAFVDGRRGTLWFQPRALAIDPKRAASLVWTSKTGWAEDDLVNPPAPASDADRKEVPLAAASAKDRVVVVGSAESFSSAVLASDAGAGDLWMANAIRWLANEPLVGATASGPKPSQVRLVMTDGTRRAVTIVCVAVIPFLWIVLGAIVIRLRRRRA